MSWFKRERPTAPIHIPDPRRPSLSFVFKSPEVLCSSLLMAVSYYFLIVVTGSASIDGPEGLWQTFGRKSRTRLQSRASALLPDSPLVMSFDMVMAVLCIFTVNSLLAACSRVLATEQRRVEEEAQAAWRAAVTNPETRHEQLEKDAQKLAEKVKLWQENDERRKTGQTVRRERIKKLDVMADEVLTNIIIIISVALSLGVAYSIATQPPNQIRGLGMGGMLIVLIGGIVVCGLDRYLNSMRHYCNYVNLLCIASLLVLAARASVLAK
ncbi:hypothetical protein LBRM_04_0640 [Leishmania braziliensis MHOM/BR/75/M2904]|uniref:Uncharacterized protein n=2 Tax=Leishmania braziliensis TaxID=5660 RepID=A4H3X9_LEIBR|nr:hypothetical protein LBRM_04_0640 [Leishmania braziliensis MHOM/BR/75/M2904]CAJ2466101.1 unnamed protein product [Leishmania braziliensis]CAJ2466733.1 unnamed protein product [Leishmania braziliensis]CAM41541.1 hypothetical protein LBRM_04_0640 [Leishmania braziliensis MHOM/BR/75/M2904]SYZ62633.1 hypothetical_protein [Leishmania braziliensis MHOM/BR/75/M2904]